MSETNPAEQGDAGGDVEEQVVPTAGRSFRYWAFVCYSHRDREWADWLYGAVEGYAIEPRFRAGLPFGAPGRQALRPVFLDYTRVPATLDLDEAIRDALRESLYLIVIASPHAAGSARVAREIECFSAERGLANVLVVVVEGRPNAARQGYPPHEECLPEALRTTSEGPPEPGFFVAHARRWPGARETALLRLLARVIGVDYATLRLRRQRRSQILITAVAVGLVGAIALLGLSRHWLGAAHTTPVHTELEPLRFEARSPAHDFLASALTGAIADGLARTGSLDAAPPDRDVPSESMQVSGMLREEADDFVLDLTLREQRPGRAPKTTRVSLRTALGRSLELGPEVSRAILNALGMAPMPVTSAIPWNRKETQELYVEGRYLSLRNRTGDLERAVTALRAALAINPGDERTLAALSEACAGRSESACVAAGLGRADAPSASADRVL